MGKASILIDETVFGELDREASRTGLTPAAIAETAITEFFAARHRKHQAVATALREAEQGAFVSRDAVDRWVASWGTDQEAPPPKPDRGRHG